MSGNIQPADPLKYAREVVGRDPMAVFLGVSVEEVRTDYAKCSLKIKPEYLNAVDRAHGVAVYAVADQAFAVACNSAGRAALALHISMNYIAAALSGETLEAEAVPVSIGNRVSTWKIEIRGGEGRLVASAEGIAYHRK